MSKLSTSTLRFLEDQFEMYDDVNKIIATRKVELDIAIHDENIGGGKSNVVSRPVENKVIKWDQDRVIKYYSTLKDNIDTVYRSMTPEQQEICRLKFWSGDYYSWNDLADKLHYSSKTIYNKRYKILEKLAKQMGLLQ